VADSADIFLADWKGETGSRAEGRSRLSGQLSERVRGGAGVRAKISRSATASASRASIPRSRLRLRR